MVVVTLMCGAGVELGYGFVIDKFIPIKHLWAILPSAACVATKLFEDYPGIRASLGLC
jgi:hypothetical protein